MSQNPWQEACPSLIHSCKAKKKKLLNGWTMQWNNMRNNACVCCSTKQIQHEEFSLLNHPKTSPVTLHYFLGNKSTIRTSKGLHFTFWNFCPPVITLVSGTSVEAFLKLLKCNQFTQRFFPSFTYLRFGLSLSCSFLLRFNCPQLVSAYDKSLGSVIKQTPGFTWLEFDLDVNALFAKCVYSSWNSEHVL